jgi:hypothetical protein
MPLPFTITPPMQEFTDKTAPHQLPFEAFGVEMRVCTNAPELLARIEQMLPPQWQRRPRAPTQHRLGLLHEDEDVYSIYHDSICVHDAPGLEYALVMLDSQIQGYVALEATEFIFIHAGVVAEGDRAIVMPGLSFSGKTTLVQALVQAGAIYFSDEFAVLDANGLVHPYPKPLSVRAHQAPTVEYPVEQLGGVAGAEPLPVGTMIATHYRPGGEWNPRELSRGAGILAMLEHAVPAQSRPEQTMRFLNRALVGATLLEGERGEAAEIARHVLDAVAS